MSRITAMRERLVGSNAGRQLQFKEKSEPQSMSGLIQDYIRDCRKSHDGPF